MATKLEAIFALIDQASAPALKIAKSLGKVDDAASKAGGGKLNELFGSGSGFGGAALAAGIGLAVTGLEKALDVAKQLGGALIEGVKFGYEQAIAVQAFEKQSMAALTATEGTADAAERALGQLKLMASALGQPRDQLASWYLGLRRVGMSADDAQMAIAGALDIKAMKGDADAIVHTFQKLAATGKFQLEGRELAKAGLSEEGVFDSLRTLDRWKKASNETLTSAMENGLITVDEGMGAIMGSISKQADNGGKLGGLAKNILGDSVEGKLERLKQSFGDLFAKIDITPLTNIIDKLNELMTSEQGKKAAAVIGQIFDRIGSAISSIASPENITAAFTAILDVGTAIGNAWDAVAPYLRMFGGAFWDSLKTAIKPVIDALGLLTDGSTKTDPQLLEGLKQIGAAAGWLVGRFVDFVASMVSWTAGVGGAIAKFIGWISEAVDWVEEKFPGVGDALKGIWDLLVALSPAGLIKKMVSLGGDLIDGIINGIRGRDKDLGAAMQKSAELLEDTLRKTSETHSPSRVFMRVGEDIIAGLNIGLNPETINDNGISDAVIDAGDRAPARASSPTSTSEGRGSVSVSIGNLNITVEKSDSPETDAERIARALRDKLGDAFEDLILETGS